MLLQTIMFHNFNLNLFIIQIVTLLFAVTVHEVAHGYVASKMGDNTARLAGRLTLNPLKHLDFIGSFLLPAILALSRSPIIFGYAKPVPVNFAKLRDYRKGVLYVASAGVLANLVLAVIAGVLFQIASNFKSLLYMSIFRPFFVDFLNILFYSVVINTVLAIFNLIPIPPLDGSRILAMVLPPPIREQFERIERFGIILIFILLMTNSMGKIISFFITPLLSFLLGI